MWIKCAVNLLEFTFYSHTCRVRVKRMRVLWAHLWFLMNFVWLVWQHLLRNTHKNCRKKSLCLWPCTRQPITKIKHTQTKNSNTKLCFQQIMNVETLKEMPLKYIFGSEISQNLFNALHTILLLRVIHRNFHKSGYLNWKSVTLTRTM